MRSIVGMVPLLVQALCLSTTAVQAGVLEPREIRRLGSQLEQRPMVFFVAKGPADSCGHGCSEWIAAVGKLDAETPQRFRTFVATLHERNLPVFFHSPGGLTQAGAEIGRMLRERRMTAGVGQTEARRCRVFEKKDTECQNLISAGRAVDARLVTSGAKCFSACVSAFAGASSRHVAPRAFLGVHSPRFKDISQPMQPLPKFPQLSVRSITQKKLQEIRMILKRRQEIIEGYMPKPPDALVANYKQRERRYFLEMGIDPDLVDLGLKTPTERIYVLDRAELARFGIESRDKNFETSWTTLGLANEHVLVMKSITRRTLSEPAEYQTLRFQFFCETDGRAFLWYRQELALDPIQPGTTIHVTFGDRTLDFQSRAPQAHVGTGFYFLRGEEALASVTKAKTMVVLEEKAGAEAVIETRLSTAGLEAALGEFQKHCVKPATPQVKVVPVKPAWPPVGTTPLLPGVAAIPR